MILFGGYYRKECCFFMERTGLLAKFRHRYIGDKAFYRAVLTLVLPLVIQQGITSFVNLLDNVMVGALCTESISGVAIVNQLIFVFNLTIFGCLSGASIYSAQYAGVNDEDGIRRCFRFKLIAGAVISAAAILLFSFYGDTLIGLYLNKDTNTAESLALTLSEAKGYLGIILWGLVPFMLTQVYGSTLRETGATVPPMKASILSIFVNLVLNYLLIYGKFGFPEMGVRGAALATVIARYVEVAYLCLHVYRNTDRYPFIKRALRSLAIPLELVKRICVTGWPLLANEFLWSAGMAVINQCYSVRGLQVVAATNITSTVWQLFAVVMFAMGNAIAIMVGQKLGAGDIPGARDVDRKLIFTNIVIHVFIGGLIVAFSGLIPQIYNVEQNVRDMTARMLVVAGCTLPLHCFTHAAYFTLRSGGRTMLTFLFDSVFTWLVSLPLAYVLCNLTGLDVVLIYACLQCTDLIKVAIAVPLLASGSWARNVIA